MNLKAAAFLDRDGTINRCLGYIRQPSQLVLEEGAARAIRRLNESGVLAVVITNQAVIAHGLCSELELGKLHARIEELLAAQGARLDAIYYCPHHPESPFPYRRAELQEDCGCRKPKPGLILRALSELHIDASRSCMFGDSPSDQSAAEAAGVPFVGVSADYPLSDAVEAWLTGLAGVGPPREDHRSVR